MSNWRRLIFGSDDAASSDEPCITYFNLGPWPGYVGFTTSEDNFAAEMKRLNVDDAQFLASDNANATTHFLTTKQGKFCRIITIQPFDKKKTSREQYAALIAHEAMHVVQDMQKDLAQGKSLGGEAEAYLIQQIVQESLQVAWATGREIRREP